MQRTMQAPPERIISEATAFMVDSGASVQTVTDTTASFVAREAPTFGLVGTMISGWALGWDATMSAHTAEAVAGQNAATLVAVPGPEGTTVTVPDNQIVASNLLRGCYELDQEWLGNAESGGSRGSGPAD